ncbi:MAG TPA: hypothetical protein VGX23_25460 [Actinocrinis sp.]|nr:hypothetical protein [Actinocrinis sp.]
MEDLGDDRAAYRVGYEAVFGAAFGALGRDRVGDLFGVVAVGRFADVPALADVLDRAFQGQFEHLQDVPLGDRLFDAAGQGGGGAAGSGGGGDGFVGGAQGDAVAFEFVLDFRAEVGAAGDALDRFADDGGERSVGSGGGCQEVLDAAIAGDGDVELFVGGAAPALVEVFSAGLDVVVVGDDDPVGR